MKISNQIVPPGEWIDDKSESTIGERLAWMISQAKAGNIVQQNEWCHIWSRLYEIFGNSDPRVILAAPNLINYVDLLVGKLMTPSAPPSGENGYVNKVGSSRPSIDWNESPTNVSVIQKLSKMVIDGRAGELVDRGSWNTVWRHIKVIAGDTNPVLFCSSAYQGNEYLEELIKALQGGVSFVGIWIDDHHWEVEDTHWIE